MCFYCFSRAFLWPAFVCVDCWSIDHWRHMACRVRETTCEPIACATVNWYGYHIVAKVWVPGTYVWSIGELKKRANTNKWTVQLLLPPYTRIWSFLCDFGPRNARHSHTTHSPIFYSDVGNFIFRFVFSSPPPSFYCYLAEWRVNGKQQHKMRDDSRPVAALLS